MQIPTPISGDLSLYFHLPFCERKCDYCHFFVLPNKDSFKKALLKGLLQEIELRSDQLSRSKIQSIYFGGGTPALMGADSIQLLLKALSSHTSIDSLEVTLEFNPENQSEALFKSYFDIGINRISIGVQSFDDKLLKKISRTHSAQQAEQAIETAKKAGFENISIDLMYDLPTQTLEDWQATLSKATSLPVQHISLYNLSIEKETVFYKKRKQVQKEMPPSQLSLQMFEEALSTFESQGFKPYEISAFCKEGFYSRHNVGYWLQRNHLGFGPSAFSLLAPHRFQNVKNLRRYQEALKQKKFPIDFQEQLDSEPYLRESFILNLRLLQGVDLSSFESRFGPLPQELLKTIEELIQREWIQQKGRLVALTPEGRLFHDSIACLLVA